MWRPVSGTLVALLVVAGTAWGQQPSSKPSSKDQSKDSGPVVRNFGSEGDFRTEVVSEVKGKLNEEEQRQASLLMAQVFQHIDEANEALDADDTKEALKEVNKSLEAIKAIRAMLPKVTVRTKTTAPDGKVLYEDDREVQQGRIPLFEGMLHTQTFAPILAARRHAMEIAGVHLVESEAIATEAIADIGPIEGQLTRAAKALEANKAETAAKALAQALVKGIDFRFQKEDKELATARDAVWLARRSLEENNVAQALVNLELAKQRLRIYREVVSQDEQKELDQMLRDVEQLEAQLRSEGNRSISRNERARQGSTVTHWWDKINGWFHHRF